MVVAYFKLKAGNLIYGQRHVDVAKNRRSRHLLHPFMNFLSRRPTLFKQTLSRPKNLPRTWRSFHASIQRFQGHYETLGVPQGATLAQIKVRITAILHRQVKLTPVQRQAFIKWVSFGGNIATLAQGQLPQLSQQYHPDINKDPGAREKFQKVSQAWAVLKDGRER